MQLWRLYLAGLILFNFLSVVQFLANYWKLFKLLLQTITQENEITEKVKDTSGLIMEIGKFEELLKISDDTLPFEVVCIWCTEFFPVEITLARGEKVIFKDKDEQHC